jgi:uncharacterized protein YuzE
MITQKEVNFITEKISRRFELVLPLVFENFIQEQNHLYIKFHESDINRTFEISKGLILEFDKESRIIGVKIANVMDYLPNHETI